jgi:hypothetical protein
VVGTIFQIISVLQTAAQSSGTDQKLKDKAKEASMIEVLKIDLPKNKLRAMPKDERALLVLLGYMANNITMLTKLVIFSTNKTPGGVERLASSGQSQMLARLVIGFQHEAYEFIKTRFLGSKLGKKYVPLLDAEGKTALDGLKKTFGGSNILSKLRNQFIFHMPFDSKALDAAFEAAAKDPTLDNDWLWLFSHSNLNTFYYINDFIVMHAIMNEVGETNLIAAQKKIMTDVQSVAENMAQFLMALTAALWKENFGHVLDAVLVERISSAPNWLEQWHPFFIDFTDKPLPTP